MTREGRAERFLALLPLAVVAAVYLFHAGLFRRYVNDDAFITFRYSRSLASGLGPYFNPGEHVEGYTNFLLMVLLAPVIGLGGENAALPAAKILGVAAGIAALALAAAITAALAGPDSRFRLAPFLAAGLVAVAPSYAANSMSGLETTLYGALLTCGVFLTMRGESRDRWCGAGIAFALAALTRPEGVMVFGATVIARGVVLAVDEPRSLRSRAARRLLRDLGVVAAVVATHLAFRILCYDGELLPNTYWAKTGGFWKAGPWPYVRLGAGAPFLGLVGVLLGICGFLLARKSWMRRGAPLLAAAAAGALSPFATGTDWMPGFRLTAPYLPLLAVVIALGWCGILARVLRRPAWLAPALCVALVPVAWLAQAPARAGLRRTIDVRAAGYAEGHRALAEWLRSSEARAGDTVALMDIGIVGYYDPGLRILDTSGLTDRFIAKSPGPFLRKEFDPRYVLARRPEFVVLVLAAPIDSELPPPLDQVSPWTPIEHAILTHPEFRRDYVRPPSEGPPNAPWTDRLARRIGAARVFPHAYPNRRYLLAVFTRKDQRGA